MPTEIGHGNISRLEAENMMSGMLKQYEKETVEPRHKETQGELAEIKEIVQQGRGMLRLGTWIAGLMALVWVVVQIKQAVAH